MHDCGPKCDRHTAGILMERKSRPSPSKKAAWTDEWDGSLGTKGEGVEIGRYCVFVFPSLVHLRRKVRVDPYFLSTCGIDAEGWNHLCAHGAFNGGSEGKVTLGRWAFVGWQSLVLTASDSYSGKHGPHGPFGDNLMHRGDVVFEPFSGVASQSMVMPGTTLPEGCVIGAHSYASPKSNLKPWWIHKSPAPGAPAAPVIPRDREKCLAMASEWEGR